MLQDDNISVAVGGKDNKFLLFVAAPENEAALAASTIPAPKTRMRWCMEGFAEVQFIVRDEQANQTLVAKFQTDGLELFHYMLQHYGAQPVK